MCVNAVTLFLSFFFFFSFFFYFFVSSMTPVPTISITTPELENKDFIARSGAGTPESPKENEPDQQDDLLDISQDNEKSTTVAAKVTLKEFYQHKSILLTGATGFIGKAVLWKLLYSLSDSVDRIFVLLRPTRLNQQTPEGKLKDDILSNKAIIYEKKKRERVIDNYCFR
jgi:hypothetical protein